MAGEDYSVKTKVTADVSDFEKGMNKAEKSLKGFSEKLANSIDRLGKKGLVGSIANVTLAMQGLTKSFSTVIKFAQDVGKAINECTEAYKGQVIAERALDTAIQNNPFVTGESSKALKEFASEMQRVSNYGDEELIPMMANLVSLGRTESETMQIMSVAMDMSAGMGISLDSAITQLNATLNGSIGRLGQQNKELKGLTEEELKQGKAVDILEKKFKGFASATADTSKQLKNIKGDFKEVIGQFTLPSSDMWNRFWAGFYQSGIDVINRFNDYLDTQIIGKKILDNLKSNAKAVSNATGNTVEEVLSDLRYLKEQISYLSDSELSTLQKTLEKQKDRSEAEERMLTIVKEITNSRKLNLDYERELAEKEAKKAQALTEQEEIENGIAELKAKHLAKIKEQEEKWKNTERVMGKAVSLEEKLKFYQDDLVAIMTEAGGQITTNNEYYKKQSAIINEILSQLGETVVETEWQKKLFDQKIEMLEAERDKAMQNAEQEGKESYTIWRDYNEKILELKLQRLEREKNEALNKEGLTEQDKVAIEEYYSNETKKIYDDLGDYKKGKRKEEKKDAKEVFTEIIAIVKKYAENVKRVFSNIANTVKDVFSGIGNIAKKLLDVFKLNPDDALNSLLAIEDAILTFFVDTLPKLPQFFQSAIQSIIILLDTLISSINWEDVQKVLNSILDMIIKNAPKIIDKLLDLVLNIAQTLLNGLIYFIDNGGWKMLLDCLLIIQKKLEQFVVDNIDEIVQTIIDMLPDLIQYLTDSIVSASKTLKKLLKPLIKLTMAFVEAIFEVLLSDEVLEASLEVIVELLGAIAEELIPRLAYLIPKLIVKIIGFIVKNLAKIVGAIVEGLIQGFAKINWFEVIKECFMGFIDGFKDLFGIHSPSKLFEEFGGYIVEGLWNGIKDLAGWLWNNLKSFFETMFANLKNLISNAWNGLKSAFGNMGSWFQEVFGNVGNVFSNIGSGIQSAFSGLQSFFSNLFSNIGSGIQSFISSAWSSISSFASSVGSTISGVMSSLWSSVSSTVSSVANQLYSGIQSAISRVRDAISSVGRGIRDFFGFANGTNDAPKGLALVGEQGPELIRFNGGEQVLNTRNTQKALEGAGGNTNNFNVTFNNLQDTTAFAMMNQLKQYNRQMAINGVI